jgi:hypothetical protein
MYNKHSIPVYYTYRYKNALFSASIIPVPGNIILNPVIVRNKKCISSSHKKPTRKLLKEYETNRLRNGAISFRDTSRINQQSSKNHFDNWSKQVMNTDLLLHC